MRFFSGLRSKLLPSKLFELSFSFGEVSKRVANLPLVVWLVFLLVILLSAAVAQWWWRFQLPAVPSELVTSKSAAPAPTSIPIEKLAQLHLFGQNIEQDINALPETTLQLTLKGIYSDPKQELGSAIIAVPGQSDEVYLAGDTLPGGATLLDIYEDRVILRRAGQLEVLMLPQRRLELKNK
ncbi:MAG: type II secretion system protein N [Gammaproteobacteria bacterium]